MKCENRLSSTALFQFLLFRIYVYMIFGIVVASYVYRKRSVSHRPLQRLNETATFERRRPFVTKQRVWRKLLLLRQRAKSRRFAR